MFNACRNGNSQILSLGGLLVDVRGYARHHWFVTLAGIYLRNLFIYGCFRFRAAITWWSASHGR